MITFNFESVVSSNREPYNNVAAHEELKSMMSRFDRLNIFFDIDEDALPIAAAMHASVAHNFLLHAKN